MNTKHTHKQRTERPRLSKRNVSVPLHRPNGHSWLSPEIATLHYWSDQLLSMPRKVYDRIEALDDQSSRLMRSGWTEVMPGMWAKECIGPLQTGTALRYDRQMQKMHAERFSKKANHGSTNRS